MKKIINSLFSIFGYKLKKEEWLYEKDKNLMATLGENKISSIIDVGANTGQFAESIFKNNFKGNIFSLEPLKQEHEILLKKKKKSQFKWQIAKRCALGSAEKKIKINISGLRQSSSILEITNIHTDLFPKSKNIGVEEIDMFKLDYFFDTITKLDRKILLKIDTQGYELEILKGAKKIISIIDAILIEVSLVELYKNQPLLEEMLNHLKSLGFYIWSVDRAIGNNNTGRTYQLDIFFVKNH